MWRGCLEGNAEPGVKDVPGQEREEVPASASKRACRKTSL